MRIKQLNDQVSVSDQLVTADLEQLVDMGIELLVCNRPDNEDQGQTPYEEIAECARIKGLDCEWLPFASYQISNNDRDELIKLINRGKKLHLYCRSGSRSRRLWIAANKIGCGGSGFQPRKEQV